MIAIITNAQLSLAGSRVHRGAAGQRRAFLSMYMPGSTSTYLQALLYPCSIPGQDLFLAMRGQIPLNASPLQTQESAGGFVSAACGLSLQQFWAGSLCPELLRIPRNHSGHSFPFQLFRGSYCAKMCWKLSPAVHLRFASGCHPATLTTTYNYNYNLLLISSQLMVIPTSAAAFQSLWALTRISICWWPWWELPVCSISGVPAAGMFDCLLQ